MTTHRLTANQRIRIDPDRIPQEPGCLSLLVGIADGKALDVMGDSPPALHGAKWPDVYSWQVLYWQAGRVWLCLDLLMTESPAPWSLWELQENHRDHPAAWKELK